MTPDQHATLTRLESWARVEWKVLPITGKVCVIRAEDKSEEFPPFATYIQENGELIDTFVLS